MKYIRTNRQTIKSSVSLTGIGIHYGTKNTITIQPATCNTGIVFIKNNVKIPALYNMVVGTSNCTEIGNNNVKISTIEHLISALFICGINDCFIETSDVEIPVMDGSAIDFINEISNVGNVEFNENLLYIKILKDISIDENGVSIKLSPYDGYYINGHIDFDHPCIGKQSFGVEINQKNFTKQIAPARTFGFLKNSKYLKSRGLGMGGSVDSAIVFDNNNSLNELRFDNECIRHKIMDIVGDLALAPHPLLCRVDGVKMGHRINNLILHKIFENKDNYEIISF